MLKPFKVGTEKEKDYPGDPLPGTVKPLREIQLISTTRKSRDIILYMDDKFYFTIREC